ncbi:hypothetical protein Tsubulata_027003 [Turnera subulata]|uniref:DUF4283 domain-containing protein n=1 Tax=Turnera subulata TaxID=218843 RepID=A0A9Q0JBS6_9ROSI|nr:hypothetical protein Tsubulata_027003 [Turnera subulata]
MSAPVGTPVSAAKEDDRSTKKVKNRVGDITTPMDSDDLCAAVGSDVQAVAVVSAVEEAHRISGQATNGAGETTTPMESDDLGGVAGSDGQTDMVEALDQEGGIQVADTTATKGVIAETDGTAMVAATKSPSFCDILAEQRAGNDQGVPEQEVKPEVEVLDGDFSYVSDKYGLAVRLSESFKERLEKRWDYTVVVKLLGRTVGYCTLCGRLQTLWKPSRPMKIVDLEDDFSWLGWTPWDYAFRASEGQVSQAVIWARFADFPPCWYNFEVLRALGNLVGGAMRVDANTKEAIRGKYARVAVEVNLTKPLHGTVEFDDRDFKEQAGTSTSSGVGSWMNAPRRGRRRSRPAETIPVRQTEVSGSQFNVFNSLAFQEMEQQEVVDVVAPVSSVSSPPRQVFEKRACVQGSSSGSAQGSPRGRPVSGAAMPAPTVGPNEVCGVDQQSGPVSPPLYSVLATPVVPLRAPSAKHTVSSLHPQTSQRVVTLSSDAPVTIPESFVVPPSTLPVQPIVLERPPPSHTRPPDLNVASRTKTPDKEKKKAPMALPLKKAALKVSAARKLSLRDAAVSASKEGTKEIGNQVRPGWGRIQILADSCLSMRGVLGSEMLGSNLEDTGECGSYF